MKTKLFSFFFALIASVGTLFAWDYEKVQIGDLYFNLDSVNKTAEVTSGESYSGDVIIPASVKYNSVTYSVTSIGDYAFYYCYSLTSIEIPNSVTSIGSAAFVACSSLTSIDIPNSVTSIGEISFSHCSRLTSVMIGNSVTSIGSGAFVACSSLTSVEIPNSVTSIGDRAFSNCSGLTSIEIPNSVTSIGQSAFYGCSGLTSIDIPNSVTSIGSGAFYDCSNLISVTWNAKNCTSPSSSDNAPFYNICNQITSFTLGEEVETIPSYLCYEMSNLTSITIPNSVTSIGDYAFYRCSGLTSITNYAITPQTISSNVFDQVHKSRCTLYVQEESVDLYKEADVWKKFSPILSLSCSIASGTCGENLTWKLFCDGVLKIRGAGTMEDYDYADKVPWYSNRDSITSIVIADGVTSIGDYAFRNCNSLTSIEIPNTVTSIGNDAFYNCSGLTSIDIPNSVTSIGDGAFWGCTGLTSIEIPNSVTIIWSRAFYGCSSLTGELMIPNSVTSIGYEAFYNCTGLTNVTIGNSVASIGDRVLSGCSGLENISVDIDNTIYDSRDNCNAIIETATNTLIVGCKNSIIPNSVTSIGQSAFYGCSGLTSIDIPNSVTSIGNNAFYSCSGLTSIEIPNSVTSIGGSAFYNCTGLTNVTIGNSVTSIGYEAFLNCTGLTNVTIGNSVTSIGDYAFSNCSGLTSIDIPNSVTSIGDEAFSSCSGLTSIEIPNSVTSIGVATFYKCSGLTSVTIPNSVTSIGDIAFSCCSSLENISVDIDNTIYDSRDNCNAIIETVTNTLIVGCKNSIIPNSVASIGDRAFSGCSTLTSVEIPNSVTSIGDRAFNGCSGLTSIEIPNSVTSIEWGTFYHCSGLTSVTIPNSVTSIGDYAFYDCSGLASIENYATTPQTISSIVFYHVDKSSCALYVPQESLMAYREADVWKEFGNIVAIGDDDPSDPKISDLENAGYDITSNLVLCFKFCERACFDVVFAGTYKMVGNAWVIDPSQLVKFSALDGFDDWFVAEVPYSAPAWGKPIQLDADGAFSWSYQSGDKNAWTKKSDGKIASISAGYSGECDILYPQAGAYIYEIAYWKNYNTPCPSHTYTIQLYAPDACPEMQPAIIGDFNNWSKSITMSASFDENSKEIYTYSFEDRENHRIAIKEATDTEGSNVIQYYDSLKGIWSTCYYQFGEETTIVLDYSNNEKYRYANCKDDEPDPEGTEIHSEKSTLENRKILVNNQLLILRGDKTYTVTGQEAR